MKRNFSDAHLHRRSRNRSYRLHKRARLRESVGILAPKSSLSISLLNVDGYTHSTQNDVKDTILEKTPDVCILLETKRRKEVVGNDVKIDGYKVIESRRSNSAKDKDGGGILMYLRNDKGYEFLPHNPIIANPEHAFINNERLWVTVDSCKHKTAICGAYLGFQAGDDRHSSWNEIIYEVLATEVYDLRQKGYRVVLLGDFNAHVGDVVGVGVPGNHRNVNRNGNRFLNFLHTINSVHLNGACRVEGDWSTRISEGLWTWQRNGLSTIIDYGVISPNDLNTVKSFVIDDKGHYPSGSDHNWIFCELSDSFKVKMKLTRDKVVNKPKWNFKDDHDWKPFTDAVESILVNKPNLDTLDVNNLAKELTSVLSDAAKTSIGFKPLRSEIRCVPTSVPKDIVLAIVTKRSLEASWKSQLTELMKVNPSERSHDMTKQVQDAERLYLDQKGLVEHLLYLKRCKMKCDILKKCQGNSVSARKNFWSYVSPKEQSTLGIECVQSNDSLIHDKEGIKCEDENHLQRIFLGSFDPISDANSDPVMLDHPYAISDQTDNEYTDHTYSMRSTSVLPCGDGSGNVKTDPQGFMDKPFSNSEVINVIKKLQNNKALGFDSIPNEFIKNSGKAFHILLTVLYNKILQYGVFPNGWNKGRISLIHKRGSRELLGNYRPLTVIIAFSGLYSRLLNERLIQVVETHNLLGEIQNGFRRGRCGADNNFILDTILWKNSAKKSKTFFAFFDISKAYDSVDRNILWHKLSGLGFGGHFLKTIQSIYTDDSVQCEINGLKTRPIYLRRGLRQGCSLSPLLFNLYISSLGHALTLSNLGIKVGRVYIAGLLFADDLVVIARTKAGLLNLIALVKRHSDALKLDLNTEKNKSEVLAQTGNEGDTWDLVDAFGANILSLKQVMQYKYLGTQVYSVYYYGQNCPGKAKTVRIESSSV